MTQLNSYTVVTAFMPEPENPNAVAETAKTGGSHSEVSKPPQGASVGAHVQFPLAYGKDGVLMIRKGYEMNTVRALNCCNDSSKSTHSFVDEKQKLVFALGDACAAKYRSLGFKVTPLP